jgi:CHAD domain-containing protein
VKPRRVELNGVRTVRDVIDAIVQTRREEAESLATALSSRQMQELHDFRIACKRLRYAMERFCKHVPELEEPAARLAEMQDALGEAHDRDVLLTVLPPTMPETEQRLKDERAALVQRAAEIWESLKGLESVTSWDRR